MKFNCVRAFFLSFFRTHFVNISSLGFGYLKIGFYAILQWTWRRTMNNPLVLSCLVGLVAAGSVFVLRKEQHNIETTDGVQVCTWQLTITSQPWLVVMFQISWMWFLNWGGGFCVKIMKTCIWEFFGMTNWMQHGAKPKNGRNASSLFQDGCHIV